MHSYGGGSGAKRSGIISGHISYHGCLPPM
nr:MAG TPA: hypothetical protein [Caudoviricetes sp.]